MTDPTPQTTPTRDEAVPERPRIEPLLKDGDVVERLKQFRMRWQESGDLTYLGKTLVDAIVEIEALRKALDIPALAERIMHRLFPQGSTADRHITTGYAWERLQKDIAKALEAELLASAPAPASGRVDAVARCLATGNPVGTDTWQVGHPCRCANCASLSPAATPVSEAEPDWMEAQQVRKRRGVEIMQEYAWGNLTPLGVANHLKRAGFNIDYAIKVSNALAKPASSPAPVRPIGNQGISDYQREIARNMAEGFAAWNAARQEALPSDEPASSPAGGDVATGLRAEIAHDGFTGDIIGRYVTREGKRGAVVQQDGTRVVHVYGEKWLPIETQMALSQSTSAGRGDNHGS